MNTEKMFEIAEAMVKVSGVLFGFFAVTAIVVASLGVVPSENVTLLLIAGVLFSILLFFSSFVVAAEAAERCIESDD